MSVMNGDNDAATQQTFLKTHEALLLALVVDRLGALPTTTSDEKLTKLTLIVREIQCIMNLSNALRGRLEHLRDQVIALDIDVPCEAHRLLSKTTRSPSLELPADVEYPTD